VSGPWDPGTRLPRPADARRVEVRTGGGTGQPNPTAGPADAGLRWLRNERLSR